MTTEKDLIRCYEISRCKREKTCIGAMYDEKCWTRAGTYAYPPVFICMLLESKIIDNCDACSYFRIMKKLTEVTDVINDLKKAVADGTDNF